MNDTTTPKPTTRPRSTQQLFLDEVQSAVENGYPELTLAIDYTAGNQLIATVYDQLEPVCAFRGNFQSDYARIDSAKGQFLSTGWGNGMKQSPRDAYNDLVAWIEANAR